MIEENISEKEITCAEDLSTAIKKLEIKKEAMEDDFKKEAHYFFENLNPVNVFNRTLENVKESSPSRHPLIKEALAFGAGYLSKRKLIHQFKNALINTFRIHVNTTIHNMAVAIDNPQENRQDYFKQTENKSKKMNIKTQSETVKAKPEVLPEPTYWPFFLAMGLAFLGWGLLTTWLISLAGFIILVIALTGWINILRHE